MTEASIDAASPVGPSRGSVAGAGVSGGSIGTALAAYAASLKPGSAPQTLLTVGAPLVSIGVGGLWLFVKLVWIDPVIVARKDKAREKQTKELEQNIRADLEAKIRDPATSDAMRAKYGAALEKLDEAYLDSIVVRIEGFTGESR